MSRFKHVIGAGILAVACLGAAGASAVPTHGTPIPAETLDELDQPIRLVCECPRPLEIRDSLQPLRQLVYSRPDVALESERRVLERVCDYPLVARSHDIEVAPVRGDRESVTAE